MTRILFSEGCTRSAVAHTPYLEQGFYLLCWLSLSFAILGLTGAYNELTTRDG